MKGALEAFQLNFEQKKINSDFMLIWFQVEEIVKALQLDFEQHLHLKWKIIRKGALEVGMPSECLSI